MKKIALIILFVFFSRMIFGAYIQEAKREIAIAKYCTFLEKMEKSNLRVEKSSFKLKGHTCNYQISKDTLE